MLNLMNGVGSNQSNVLSWINGSIAGEQATAVMDFENNRYAINQTPVAFDDLITYVRAGEHSYIDTSGNRKIALANEAPIDHSQGFAALARFEATTNICPAPFSPVTWINVLSNRTAASETMQDYFTAGAEIASNGASFQRINSDTFSWTGGETYLISVFVKEGTKDRLGVYIQDSATGDETVFAGDLGNPFTLSFSNAGTLSVYDYKDLGNGFWEYYFEFIPANTTTLGRIGFGPNSTTAGDSINIYSCQIEENTFPTPFTTGTRSTPNIQVNGSAFSSLYNQNEGTIEIEFYQPYSVAELGRLFQVSGATGNQFNVYFGNNDTLLLNAGTGGVNQINQPTLTSARSDFTQRVLVTYQDNNSSILQTDSQLNTDTSCIIAKVMISLSIGDTPINNRGNSFWVRSMTYWPKALDQTALMANFDYVLGGDSFMTGRSDRSIGRVLKSRGYDNWNTGQGASSLEQAVSRIEALNVTKKVIFCDGSNNNYDPSITGDVARYQRAYDAASGDIIILTPMLHANIAGTPHGQATLDLSAALVSTFSTNVVVDITALAHAQSGVAFIDPTDASDAGYSDLAYANQFPDGTHPTTALYEILTDAALALV